MQEMQATSVGPDHGTHGGKLKLETPLEYYLINIKSKMFFCQFSHMTEILATMQ